MRSIQLGFTSVATVLMLCGCNGTWDECEKDPDPNTAVAAILEQNAINPNAINPNAINPNALVPSTLAAYPLTPSTLDPSALAAIQDPGEAGELSRMLLKYLVSCALASTNVFAFSWTDSYGVVHPESYPGLLKLATSWLTSPLNETDQEWVSACIGARTNWYGQTVMISVRGSHQNLKGFGSTENPTYPNEEGAFWGNIFGSTPFLKACHHVPNIDHSRQLLRDCAAGHLVNKNQAVECGIIDILGSCGVLCEPLDDSGKYHPKCFLDPNLYPSIKTGQVITVFLQ